MTMWRLQSKPTSGPSSLPQRAEQLAEIEDLGEEATRLLGAGRGAGLDPDALTSLAQAALALGASSAAVYRAESDAAASDGELLGDAEELEHATAATLEDALRLQHEAQAQLRMAEQEQRAGQADLNRALAMSVSDPCKGCHQAKERAIAAAQRRIDDAMRDQEYCTEALETLAQLITVLRQALEHLRRVAEDLTTTYEQIYGFLADGGQLPHDGRFFTGEEAGPGEMVLVPGPATAKCPYRGCDGGVLPGGTQCPHCHGYGEVVLRAATAAAEGGAR